MVFYCRLYLWCFSLSPSFCMFICLSDLSDSLVVFSSSIYVFVCLLLPYFFHPVVPMDSLYLKALELGKPIVQFQNYIFDSRLDLLCSIEVNIYSIHSSAFHIEFSLQSQRVSISNCQCQECKLYILYLFSFGCVSTDAGEWVMKNNTGGC